MEVDFYKVDMLVMSVYPPHCMLVIKIKSSK